MQRAMQRIAPFSRHLTKINLPGNSTRTFCRGPFANMETRVRELDRVFDRLERDMVSAFRNVGFPAPSPYRNFFSPLARAWIPVIENGTVDVNNESGKFCVRIDMGHLMPPENIKVTLKERVVTIHGKLEQKSNDGNSRVYQEFSRRFTLPDNVNIEEVKSTLSPDGVLVIEAPLPAAEEAKPKEIPITKE